MKILSAFGFYCVIYGGTSYVDSFLALQVLALVIKINTGFQVFTFQIIVFASQE